MTTTVVGIVIAWVAIDALVALALWCVFRAPEPEHLRRAIEEKERAEKAESRVERLRQAAAEIVVLEGTPASEVVRIARAALSKEER